MHKVGGDVEAKSGSTELSCYALVRLGEWLEKLVELFGLNSNSGVCNSKDQTPLVSVVLNFEFDPPFVGKLNCVTKEVY